METANFESSENNNEKPAESSLEHMAGTFDQAAAEKARTEQSSQLAVERKKRTHAERMQRFINLATGLTIPESRELEGEEKLDYVLEHTTPEGALKFLQHLNSQLRQDRPQKGGSNIYGSSTKRMRVNSGSSDGQQNLIAPEPELQQKLLSEYLDAIKKADSRDKKATLAFYAINNLHLFEDGNGRTSRAVYELLKTGDISSINQDYIEHETKSAGESGKGRDIFMTENHLLSPDNVNHFANLFVQEDLCDSGELNAKLRDKEIFVISESLSTTESGLVSIKMKKANRQQLSAEDKIALSYAISDGDGYGWTTLAGLTLAVMLDKKGKADDLVDRTGANRNLGIRVNYDPNSAIATKQDVRELFVDWEPEDYRETLDVYRSLKQRQNEMIMRFFTEDISFDNGLSVADWITSANQS